MAWLLGFAVSPRLLSGAILRRLWTLWGLGPGVFAQRGALTTIWHEDAEKPGFEFPLDEMFALVESLINEPVGRSGTTTTTDA